MNLSPNFTLKELVHSDTAIAKGIDNVATVAQLQNLRALAERLERVRVLLGGKSMRITSGLRVPLLNRAVGGSATSMHLEGLAADFVCPAYGTPLEICKLLAQHKAELGFDQIIQEGTWVHFGLARAGRTPRGEVLTKVPGGYAPGL